MPIDVDDTFRRGGKPLIELLEFAVRSLQHDLVFTFLVREYQWHPTRTAAQALYDVCCAPDALARIKADTLLPPRDPRLPQAIRLLEPPPRPTEAEKGPARSCGVATPKYLFDFLLPYLDRPDGIIARLAASYDPELGPWGNLPGRRMTPAAQFFVDRVWEPRLRPRLIAAGFRRLGSVA